MVDSSSGRAKIARPSITATAIASSVSRHLVFRGDGREAGRHGDPSFVVAGSWLILREEMWSDDARADVLPFFGYFSEKIGVRVDRKRLTRVFIPNASNREIISPDSG